MLKTTTLQCFSMVFSTHRGSLEATCSVEQLAFSSSGASKRLDERVISSIFELGGFEDARAVIEASGTQRDSRAGRIRSELRTIDRAFEGVDLLYLSNLSNLIYSNLISSNLI